MCAQTVTGSLLAGSPHRLVRFRLYSVVLSLRWIDDLNISRESPIPQKFHLGTTDRRITPDICSPGWSARVEIYLLLLREIVLILCSFCIAFATRAMASDRSPNQAGPSYAPSAPLPGTFFGPTLDITSEKLYDLAPDIPDVMGLRALRPSAAVVKVMSVPDSRCIRVVTPDDHVNIGFHEILLHDMGEEELPFVATSELRRIGRGPCLFLYQDTSRIWNACGRNARNGLAVHSPGTVHIVACASSGIWANTLILPHRTRAAVALSSYVVHGVEGDCSGLY